MKKRKYYAHPYTTWKLYLKRSLSAQKILALRIKNIRYLIKLKQQNKMNYAQIATEVGLSRQTISNRLKSMGL